MEKMIAVLLGVDGRTISSEEEGFLRSFKRENGEWQVVKDIPFCVDKTQGLAAVRSQIDEMAQSVLPCKIIVSKKISGIFYTALDVLGFSIWELDGTPDEMLESVWEDAMCKLKAESLEDSILEIELPSPKKVDDSGYYFFNLMEVLKFKGNHTSKKVLKPFFKNGDFKRLEIICDHVPPWFYVELSGFDLEMEVEIMPEYYKVIVEKQNQKRQKHEH